MDTGLAFDVEGTGSASLTFGLSEQPLVGIFSFLLQDAAVSSLFPGDFDTAGFIDFKTDNVDLADVGSC